MEIIGGVLGYVAVVLIIFEFQFDRINAIRGIKIITSVCMSIHYLSIGAMAGFVLAGLGAVRLVLYIKYEGNKFVLGAFLVLLPAVVLFSNDGWISVFPLLALIIGTVAFWVKEPRSARYLSLISVPTSMVYSIYIGSVQAIVIGCIALFSVLRGVYRFDLDKKSLQTFTK